MSIQQNSKTIAIVTFSIAVAFGIMFAAIAPMMQAFAVSEDDGVKLLKKHGCSKNSQGDESSGGKCRHKG
jgi:hypothetical protein